MLDPHLRIAQTELFKAIAPSHESQRPPGQRSWHTDWPHDLSAYLYSNATSDSVMEEPWRNAGTHTHTHSLTRSLTHPFISAEIHGTIAMLMSQSPHTVT
jgi:hypothetical protein